MRMRWLLCVMMTMLLVSCGGKEDDTAELRIRPVKSVVVKASDSLVERQFPGKVLPTQHATLSFEVPGRLIELLVLEGDQVKKGQKIAALVADKYRDEVSRAKAKLELAKGQLGRAKVLIKKDFISRFELDKIQTSYDVAKANLNSAQKDLNDTVIFAPFNGTIAKRHVENFELVKEKQPIVELHNVKYVDIETSIPEDVILNIRQVQADQEKNKERIPKAFFEAFPDKGYDLTVKEFSSAADPDTQTYSVIFKMPQPEEITVLGGMTATVKVAIPDISHRGNAEGFVVPASSVFIDNNNNRKVWVINPETMTVSPREVEVTRLNDKSIRIIKGLKEGERIVTAGVHLIRDGQKVRLVQGQTQQ